MVKANGFPSCISTSLIPLLEASHYKTKVLLNLNRARTGVVHLTFFKYQKAHFVASFHLNFFFRKVVRGDAILP
jgi:hypothetical protein